MPLTTQRIESLLNGVSQLAPQRRLDSQGETQINALSSLLRGLTKRPPSNHAARLDPSPTGYGDAFLHTIDRDATERYRVIVYNGTLKVFTAAGSEVTTLFPQGKAYLTSASPNQTFRGVTVGDSTYLLSRDKTVSATSTTSPAATYEALLHVAEGDFDTIYRVKIDGTSYTYATPRGDTPDDRNKIDTLNIATQLKAVLHAALGTTFNFTQYGSAIHIARVNGADFTMEVEDGLSGLLIGIKGKVQRLSDLPKVSKNGFTVEITGDDSTGFDNYWVKYDDTDTAYRGGVWVETVAPGEEIELDPTTLPHVLERGRGTVLDGLVADTQPNPTAAVDDNTATVYDGWSAAQNTAAPENGSVVLQSEGAVAYSNLEDADTNSTTYTVVYDINCTNMGQDQGCVVRIYTNDAPGSTSWTQRSSKTYLQSDGYLPNEEQSFAVALGANYDLRVLINYVDDPLDGSKASIVMHGEDHSIPGVRYVPLGANNPVDVTFGATQIYPAGTLVRVTVNGTNCDRTPSSDETGAQVATALQPTIDAVSGITATNPSAGVIHIVHTTTTPTVTPTTGFNATKQVILTESLGFEDDSLVGLTVQNVTDGSTTTITSNSSRVIEATSSLTGGGDNNFANGDSIRVTTTGTYFVFKRVEWNDREVGDITTNPFPSFIGANLSEIFYHRGRLGVTAGENVLLAEAGNPTNWFRSTVTQYVDSDPIDVEYAGAGTSQIHGAVEIDRQLFLWSDLLQLSLEGSPLLTPKTVQLPVRTRYESTSRLRPLVVGDRVLFAQANNNAVEIFEFLKKQTQDDEIRYLGNNLTLEVRKYIQGQPIQWAASAAHGLVAILTDSDKSKLYVFKQSVVDGRRLQASWSEWQFGTNDEILGVDFIGDTMGIVVKRTEGIFLETMNVHEGYSDSGLTSVRRVDRRMDQTVATPAYAGGNTTWTLPFDIPSGDGTLQVVNKATGQVYTSSRPSASTIRVDGIDLSATPVWIGWQYTMTWQFSTVYRRNREGQALSKERLNLAYIEVDYAETKDFTLSVDVQRVGGSAKTKTFSSTDPNGEEGTLRFPVMTRNTQAIIQLINSTPNDCGFVGVNWEGSYEERTRRG